MERINRPDNEQSLQSSRQFLQGPCNSFDDRSEKCTKQLEWIERLIPYPPTNGALSVGKMLRSIEKHCTQNTLYPMRKSYRAKPPPFCIAKTLLVMEMLNLTDAPGDNG